MAKAISEKASTTTSTTATQTAKRPFFSKADESTFFAPVTSHVTPAVQMKMTVNKAGDKFEQEADRMADKVMRMPAPASSTKEEKLQRQTDDKLQKKEGEKLQRKGDGTPTVSTSTQSAIQNKNTGGQSLSSDVRSYMEPRFGADFSNIRIHTDHESANLSNQLSARAFTYQNHIHFSHDQYQPETGEGKHLLAHELTHTIQQGHAIQRSPQVTTTTTPPPIQRFGITNLLEAGKQKLLDELADKAYYIPGFRMLTIVIGFNPINGRSTDRSAANILRALIELVLIGPFITRALDNYGIFNKVGAWVEPQLAALSGIGSEVINGVKDFMTSLSLPDIGNLSGLWERAKNIFVNPGRRLISFAENAVTGIMKFVKEAILKPLAAMAQGTRGYDLLRAILGQDPITGEQVPRNPETLIGGFMKLVGQEEVWENIKKGNAIARTWVWFQGALSGLMGFARAIPGKIIETITSLSFQDIVTITSVFAKIVGGFVNIADQFFRWGLNTVWKLLEIVFDVVKPGVLDYIKRTGAALKSILKNPLPFVSNLVKAATLGFKTFATNFGEHLKTGLIDWLTGSLPGVYIPKAFSLSEVVKFVFSVLGLTWQNIRQKLVKAVGEPAVKVMEEGFELVRTLVTKGPAAAWEHIKDQLSNLKDMVIGGITDFVTDTIVKKAVPKLVAMFIPGAGFISAILSIYDTVMVFVKKISSIAQVVTGFIDSIVDIAAGTIGTAVSRIETILARLLSLAINFLAGFLGLSNISSKIMGVIDTKVRAPIDKALDKLVNWIVMMAKKLLVKNEAPEKRLKLALDDATIAVKQFSGPVTNILLKPVLAAIRIRYNLKSIKAFKKDGAWWVEAEINPKKSQKLVDEKVPMTDIPPTLTDVDRGRIAIGDPLTSNRTPDTKKPGIHPDHKEIIIRFIKTKGHGLSGIIVGTHLVSGRLGGPPGWWNIAPASHSANMQMLRAENTADDHIQKGYELKYTTTVDYHNEIKPTPTQIEHAKTKEEMLSVVGFYIAKMLKVKIKFIGPEEKKPFPSDPSVFESHSEIPELEAHPKSEKEIFAEALDAARKVAGENNGRVPPNKLAAELHIRAEDVYTKLEMLIERKVLTKVPLPYGSGNTYHIKK